MTEPDQQDLYGHSVGERLRQARETRGLTLDDVATQTRIPIRHLRNIEDSRWEELPAVTYTVGFARNYANAVGLDGAQLGRELRDQLAGVDRASQISPEVYAPSDPARAPSRAIVWIALILIAGLVTTYFVWRGQTRDTAPVAEAPAAAPADDAATAQPPQPAAPTDLTGQQVTLVGNANPVWFRITDRGDNNRRLIERILQPGERYQVPLAARQPVIFTTEPQNMRIDVGGRDLGLLSAERRRIRDQSLLASDLATALRPGTAAIGPAPSGNRAQPAL